VVKHQGKCFEQGYGRGHFLGERKSKGTMAIAPNCFNVGINVGSAAGQTVMHCHIHLIPRRSGDSVNSRGGVRGAIAGKADYERGG
jgi:diadenosine tetraphosphate (Ap4A) HIT family hydrolase